MICKGFARYINRLTDLMQCFPRGRSALSAIFNSMVRHIINVKGHLITDLNETWLTPVYVRSLCGSLTRKGSPYDRCFGFLDGTIRSNCRPIRNQRQVKNDLPCYIIYVCLTKLPGQFQFYNGHKRVHACKFQSLILPNGIIANMYGPVNGRRHDGHVLAKSRLIEKLEAKFNIFRTPPYIFSDTGYPLKKFLITPFKATQNRNEKIVNKKMSKLRVTVEWGFAKIIQLFPFLDFKQELGNYYKVATILTNCHTCLYGSQVCDYFELDPPTLEDYLEN